MFLFFSLFVAKFNTDNLVGEWLLYEEYPGTDVMSFILSEDEEVKNRFEATIFKNEYNNEDEKISLKDALVSNFYIDIDDQKTNGVGFKEIQNEKLFSYEISDTGITVTMNEIKYTIKPDVRSGIFVIEKFEKDQIIERLFAKHTEKDSTFDIGNYQYLLIGIMLLTVIVQIFYFKTSWEKQRKEALERERQRYLRQRARQHRLQEMQKNGTIIKEENNEEENSEEEDDDEETGKEEINASNEEIRNRKNVKKDNRETSEIKTVDNKEKTE